MIHCPCIPHLQHSRPSTMHEVRRPLHHDRAKAQVLEARTGLGPQPKAALHPSTTSMLIRHQTFDMPRTRLLGLHRELRTSTKMTIAGVLDHLSRPRSSMTLSNIRHLAHDLLFGPARPCLATRRWMWTWLMATCLNQPRGEVPDLSVSSAAKRRRPATRSTAALALFAKAVVVMISPSWSSAVQLLRNQPSARQNPKSRRRRRSGSLLAAAAAARREEKGNSMSQYFLIGLLGHLLLLLRWLNVHRLWSRPLSLYCCLHLRMPVTRLLCGSR